MNDGLRALVFDFDGTIAETERSGHRVAYNRAFREARLDWHWDEARYHQLLAIAGGRERLRYFIEHDRPPMPRAFDVESLIRDIHEKKTRHFAAIAAAIPFRPGVQRLIYEAHLAGLRVAIATTASKSGVDALLAQDSAIVAMIEIIGSAESVDRKKPEPDVYTWVLDRLQVPASACVAIEDSRIGLAAAIGAGIPTIVTISDYTGRDDFRGAEAVLTSLGDYDVAAESLAGIQPIGEVVDLSFLRSVRDGRARSACATAAPMPSAAVASSTPPIRSVG